MNRNEDKFYMKIVDQLCSSNIFRFRVCVHWDKRAKIMRTKWWKLRGEAAQTFKERILGEGPWEDGEDDDDT